MNKLVPHRKTRACTHSWSRRGRECVVLLLLAAVLISSTTATANLAGAANTTGAQPVVGARTHPIQYWIGCAPSMVNNSTLTYFEQQGFTAVVVVVPDNQTYQTQLNTIKSFNMLPIIDVEVLLWGGGENQSTPISNFSGYFQSLENAGWQYVASEAGNTSDLAYMAQYFKGYVNFNCDQCGLWDDMYANPFTVANSWESYYPSEWPYIQNGSKQAAALGIQNGICAGAWPNNNSDNQIYANSVSGIGTPSYLSMLNWSYANGIGFTSFHVYCGDNPDGLSRYQGLGFDKIVAALQVYYPATQSASLGTGKQPTQLSLTASNTTPAVNQQVTFTATLKSGTTPLPSKSVSIYHTLNGVRYNDTTKTSNATGQITLTTSFASTGLRSYYATFAGNSSYQASTSSVVTVNVTKVTVAPLSTTLNATVSTATAYVNQNFAINGTLNATDGTPITGATITLQNSTDGTSWSNVTTTATDANGTYQFSNNESAAGTYYYRTAYDGNSTYLNATSNTVSVNVL